MDPFGRLRIVVPIDFSTESDRALELALRISESPSNIRVLHVCPSPILYEPAAVFVMPQDGIRKQYQESFHRRFAHRNFDDLELDLRFGDPPTQIARYAETYNAGLIVMPSHGRTGFSHLLIGSTAERTVRLAPCPVLVLRGRIPPAAQGAMAEPRGALALA
jgi:nucleotide-binding universal stress UspA family protein